MELVDVEHVFGGERIVVYYLAEERVDFRELVKTLAAEFQTRIEMRQIGVRDEAKLLADYGDCGKPVCCNTHLPEMPPVSMKMAKLQKATLDPDQNLRPLRPAEMLPAIRVRYVRRPAAGAAADRGRRRHQHRPRPRAGAGNSRSATARANGRQPADADRGRRRAIGHQAGVGDRKRRVARLRFRRSATKNMPEQTHPIVQLLQDDQRYKLEAYQFVRDGLQYAQEVLQLGEKKATSSGEAKVEQHLTGQQLCDAIRQYAISQYGLMAKTVLNSWGLCTTSDFGEVVYNLIRVGLMKKSKSDRREDFNDCYSFDDAFRAGIPLREDEVARTSRHRLSPPGPLNDRSWERFKGNAEHGTRNTCLSHQEPDAGNSHVRFERGPQETEPVRHRA